VLLDDTITEPLRDVVFAAVERERLAAAVTAIGQLTRSPDDRARELVTGSYTGVRRYLPLLLTRSSSTPPTAARRSLKR
jgi:hypothetical protein